MGARIRAVEEHGEGLGLFLGGWDLCESWDRQGEGGVAGGDWSQKDGSKRFLELEPSYRESKESWALVLRQMKSRGVKSARLSFHRFGNSSQFRPFMLLVVVATAFISRVTDT